MKVPKKITDVISSVRKHKIPGFIYNLPVDLQNQISDSLKDSVVIDAIDIRTSYHIVNAVTKALKIETNISHKHDGSLIAKIHNKIGSKTIIINRPEFLASTAYDQVKDFGKAKIPVLLLSSYSGFIERLRETKYYQHNLIIEYDCNDLSGKKKVR